MDSVNMFSNCTVYVITLFVLDLQDMSLYKEIQTTAAGADEACARNSDLNSCYKGMCWEVA